MKFIKENFVIFKFAKKILRYDPDARYMCTPTRDEIFRLLVGLHETHKGNERKLVNFCNRRRPAKTVFTNIRFLG